MKRKIIWILFFIFSGASLFAQEVENKEKTETTVKVEKEKKDEKKFELNALIQFWAASGQENSSYSAASDFDTVDFNFKRLRLNTKFEAASWAGSVFNLRVENLLKRQSSASPVTNIGAVQEANLWFKPGFLGSTIKAGQFKIPFIREQLTSSANFVALDRGYSSKVIQLEDLGLYLQIQPLEIINKDLVNRLDISFSVTNGDGSGIEGVGVKNGELTSSNDNLGKLVNWRVQVQPFGSLVKDGKEIPWKDGEEIFQGKAILWSIGAGGAHTDTSEFGAIGGLTGTDASGNKTHLLDTGKAFNGYTFDTTFFAHGFYLNGEYTVFTGDALTKDYNSYQATLGYNIKLGSVYLLPLVRFNYQEWDKNASGSIGDSEKENSLWIGLDLFAINHNLKFQAFYNILNDGTGDDLNKDVLYFQFQTSIGKKV